MLDTTGHRARAEFQSPNAPHAIVIGSGFGGLAAAVRLGARGYRVTVLEKLATPGGRARVHHQDGFTFDAGPTIVTAPFLFEELWQLCGRQMSHDIDLRPVTPFYRIRFHDGETFDCTGDQLAMEREIARFSPEDIAGYRRYMQASQAIFRTGFQELGHVPFGSLSDMVSVAPDLIRLQGYRSVYGLVSKYIRNERLRIVLSFHPLLIGGNPFTATSVYCLIAFLERHWGVHFAMGGTGTLVRGLIGLIEGLGGTIRYEQEVSEITVKDGAATGVRLASGERIAADIVVSNADFGMDLSQAAAAPCQAPLDRPADRARPLFDEPFCLVFRYQPDLSRRGASHHTPGSALPRAAE